MEFFDALRQNQKGDDTINRTLSVKDGDVVAIDEAQLNSMIQNNNYSRQLRDDDQDLSLIHI